jgi:hypothetical protein
MKITVYADPGHAWAKVTRKLVDSTGIKVSSYSYQRGAYVYLEEDCDLSAFIAAYNRPIEFIDRHTNKQSKIRSYESYRSAIL